MRIEISRIVGAGARGIAVEHGKQKREPIRQASLGGTPMVLSGVVGPPAEDWYQ